MEMSQLRCHLKNSNIQIKVEKPLYAKQLILYISISNTKSLYLFNRGQYPQHFLLNKSYSFFFFTSRRVGTKKEEKKAFDKRLLGVSLLNFTGVIINPKSCSQREKSHRYKSTIKTMRGKGKIFPLKEKKEKERFLHQSVNRVTSYSHNIPPPPRYTDS